MPITAWVAIVGVCVTVLVQFAGIVAFAATQRALVVSMKDVVRELKEAVDALQGLTHNLDRRVLLLEDRVGAHRRRTDDI